LYFRDEIDYDDDAVAKTWKDRDDSREILRGIRERLARAEWTEPVLEAALRGLAEERGVAAGKIFQPLRVALTGVPVSPGIFDVLLVLGRDLALRRIDRAITTLR
jgi:glutamyl-tRNA synthetase